MRVADEDETDVEDEAEADEAEVEEPTKPLPWAAKAPSRSAPSQALVPLSSASIGERSAFRQAMADELGRRTVGGLVTVAGGAVVVGVGFWIVWGVMKRFEAWRERTFRRSKKAAPLLDQRVVVVIEEPGARPTDVDVDPIEVAPVVIDTVGVVVERRSIPKRGHRRVDHAVVHVPIPKSVQELSHRTVKVPRMP